MIYSNLIMKRYVVVLLFFAVGLSPLQIFVVKVSNIWFSLSFLSAILLLPFSLMQYNLLKKNIIIILICLIGIQIISLLWAIDIRFGIRTVIYTLPFISIFVTSYWLSKKNLNMMEKIFVIVITTALIEAILVIWFRLDTASEFVFLKSKIVKIFMQPNLAKGIFTTEANNVITSAKSGGFFPNANVAGTYLAILSIFVATLSLLKQKKWLLSIGFIFYLVSFFTGSKLSIILAFLLTTIFVMFYLIKNKTLSTIRKISIVSVFICFVLLIILILSQLKFDYWTKQTKHNTMLENVQYQAIVFDHLMKKTLKSRVYGMWLHAYNEFPEHFLKGHGFGGWRQKINWEDKKYYQNSKNVQIASTMPPHNTLIYLWSQSGIFAPIFAVMFIVTILSFSIKLIRSKNYELQVLGYGLFFSYFWFFLHGMGTNYGLVGERHLLPLMSSFLGYTYAKYDLHREKIENCK